MKTYVFSFIGRKINAQGIFYKIRDKYKANSLGEALHMLYTDYEHITYLSASENSKLVGKQTVAQTSLVNVEYVSKFSLLT
jgi:hypothetical protein